MAWEDVDQQGVIAVDIDRALVRVGQGTFALYPLGAATFRVFDEVDGQWSRFRLEAGPTGAFSVTYASSTRARRAGDAWVLACEQAGRLPLAGDDLGLGVACVTA